MNPLESLRSIILLSFMALPIMIIAFVAFVAIGLSNMSMFILLAGQITALPLTVFLLHILVNLITKQNTAFGLHVPMSDVSLLVPSEVSTESLVTVAPSWWMAHVLFFLGYILANAIAVYTMEDSPTASEWDINNRKSRAVGIIIISVLSALSLAAFRYSLTNAETIYGILIAFFFAYPLGYGWYQLANACGARPADIFGIVHQVLPSSAKGSVPMTCVYAPRP